MDTRQNHVNAWQIGEQLANHVSALADMTESMNDATSTYTLRHLEPRLRQGLVRAAVIGVTSTGKSTAINALIGQLALPENPSVATPIPTWIGYQPAEGSQAEIYLEEEGKLNQTVCDLTTFKRKYCYNINDIFNRDRTRFDAVKFGTVKTSSPLLQDGLTLIDTLGISASTVDSRKTIRVLKEGVDIVIFLTKNSNLHMDEEQFLYQYILGCRKQGNDDPQDAAQTERPVRAVLPENLFLVHNDWYGAPSKTALQASVRELYRKSDLQLSDQKIDELVQNNLFFINAFRGRLGLMGAYPYAACAPEGSTPDEIDSFRESEEYEQEELEYGDPKEMLEESGIRQLAEAIQRKAWHLCHGKNSVAVRRISELVPVVDSVIMAADKRLTDIHITQAELNNQKSLYAQMKADDEQDQQALSTALMTLNQNYKRGFEKLLEDIRPSMKDECCGHALRIPMPPNFQEQFRDYLRMDINGREQYLQALLPAEIRNTYEHCTNALLKALDERRAELYKTPFEVMEETKQVIAHQADLLNARIDSLRNLGAENLGVVFPPSIIVDTLFNKLELDLEEKIKEIIANACKMSGKSFEETMQQYVKKCSLNIFRRLFSGAADRLWANITNNLFEPLAEKVVDGMSDYTINNIFMETTAAFDKTKTDICTSHIKLFVSLENAITRLEERLQTTTEEEALARTDMQKLKTECEKIKTDILYLQSRLQNA